MCAPSSRHAQHYLLLVLKPQAMALHQASVQDCLLKSEV
jgi:hypothetical protein